VVIRAVAQGLGLALVAGAGACGQAEYLCISDVECGEGQCTAAGYCGFVDDTCPSGLRYGDQADAELAGTCVPERDDDGTTTGGPSPQTSGETSGETGGAETVAVDDGPTTGEGTTGEGSTGSETGAVYDCDTWWDPAFGFRRAVVVHAPANGSPVEGFAAMVSLEPLADAMARADLADVRVLTDDCEPLPHEIEATQDESAGAVWFRAPSVGPDPVTLWLYYGNASAPDASDRAAVWSEGFVGVWHFADVSDSTAEGHGLDPGPVALFADGPIAQASVFDGVDDRWSRPPSPALTDLPDSGMTISAWVRPESKGGFAVQHILDKTTSASLSGFRFSVRQSMGQLELEVERGQDVDSRRARTVGAPLMAGEWVHVAMTLDDADPSSPRVYVGGLPQFVEILADGVGMPLSDVNVPMSVGGSAYNNNVFFDGRLDELRISSQVRSADWVRAEYLSMTGGLVSLGAEETAP